MVRAALVVAVTLGLATPVPVLAEGGFGTGNDILAMCTARDASPDAYMCLGYIEGITRRDDLTRWMKPADAYMCEIPEGVNLGQMRDIIVTYLQRNPDKRHWEGTSSALIALKEALCRK